MINQESKATTSGVIIAVLLFVPNYSTWGADSSPKVWIAARTDGQAGTGTVVDPFDGHTRSQLDTLWANTIVPSNPTSVTFAPGSYLTNGSLHPISNCVIRGYGATLKLDTNGAVGNNQKSQVIGDSDNTHNYHDVIIEGLTIDCNLQNQSASAASCAAISFFGYKNAAINCKVINFGSTSTSAECFVIGFFNYNSGAGGGNIITGCDFTQPAAVTHQFVSTLASCHGDETGTGGYPGANWSYGNKIFNNTFHDMNPTVGGLGGIICIQPSSAGAGEEIYSNSFRNVHGTCIYADTGNNWDESIHDNIGEQIYGAGLNIDPALENSSGSGHSWQNLRVQNNSFALVPQNPSYGFSLGQSSVDRGPFSGAIVRGNKITRHGSSGTVQIGFSLNNITNGIIEGNVVGPNVGNSTSNYFYLNRCSDTLVQNNTADYLIEGANNSNVTKVSNRDHNGRRLNAAADRADLGTGNRFHAKIPQSGTIANNTPVTVIFGTTVSNPGTQYNTSNGRFTPNVAGEYDISAFVSPNVLGSGSVYLEIWKNDVIEISQGQPLVGSAKVSGRVSANGTTDYFTVNWWTNCGTTTFSTSSYASGFWASKVD